MATVTKDFRVKNGLVVEGSNATVNGSQILTEASAEFIQDTTAQQFADGSHSGIAFSYDDQTGAISATVSSTPTFSTEIIFEGATADSYQTTLQVTDPTSDITLTLPNATGTIALTTDLPDMNTDNVSELPGATNKYFTDSRAEMAISSKLGTGIGYGDQGTGNVFYVDENVIQHKLTSGNAITISNNEISVTANQFDIYGAATQAYNDAVDYADGLATNYDPAGAASTVQGNLEIHTGFTSAHGVTGAIVGTSDTQTLTNKTVGDTLNFVDGFGNMQDPNKITIDGTNLAIYASNDLSLTAGNGDLLLSANGAAYLGSATAGNEIATQGYVDNAVAGLNWKQAVNLLSTSHIDLTVSGSPADFMGMVIDGHPALDFNSDGYRLLLTGQSTPSENGIYVLTLASGSLTASRPADADTYQELIGAAVYVMEGTQYGSTSWVQGDHYLTDFTGQDWTQFSGQGSVTAGTGITVDGLEVSVNRSTVDTWYESAGAVSTHSSHTTGVHGVIGHVVGTTDTQTLSNKTLSNPTISAGTGSSTNIPLSGDIFLGDLFSNGTVQIGFDTNAHPSMSALANGTTILVPSNAVDSSSGLPVAAAGKTFTITGSSEGTMDSLSANIGPAWRGYTVTNTDNALSGVWYGGGNTPLSGNDLVVTTGSIVTISSTEISYLDGVTSNIQTQLNAKQLDLGITSIGSGLSLSSGVLGFDLTSTPSLAGLTLTNALEATAVTFANSKVDSATQTVGTSAGVVDSWDSGNYSTAKYLLQFKQGNDVEVLEMLVTVDGNGNVYTTEYADVISNAQLATVSVTRIPTGIVVLEATATAANTTVKVHKTLIEA